MSKGKPPPDHSPEGRRKPDGFLGERGGQQRRTKTMSKLKRAKQRRCAVPTGSAGFLSLLSGVVEAERLVVAGLSPEMPCRKMHENRHRAFREALSMATAYFQQNTPVTDAEPSTPASTRAHGPRSV